MKRICLFLFLLVSVSAFSQKKIEQVRAASAKAKKEIQQTAKLLKQTEASKNASVEKLALLAKQIESRNVYLNSLQAESAEISKQIANSSLLISSLEAQLQVLKKDYNQALFTIYKVRSNYDQLIFVMSADNFNQAFNRLKYLQYYSDYIIQQSQRIQALKDSIQGQKAYKQKMYSQKVSVIGVQKQEAQQLQTDKEKEHVLVQELTQKQQELKKKIQEKQQLARKLDNQVEALIRAELVAQERRRKAKALADAQAKAKEKEKGSSSSKPKDKITTASKSQTTTQTKVTKAPVNTSSMSPEETIISNNFVGNKGRLPWPTAQGTITQRFGTYTHPQLGFLVESNGIEITAPAGTQARCIFEGEVTKIVYIPGKNAAIIIRHGNYFSVYDNIVNIQVRTGDKVKTKQILGTIATNENGHSVIQLQIWKELNKLNPEPWIAK